jgi:Flp pilus assembly protein TadG
MRSRRGAAAIEFGLWLPVAVLMFSGIADLAVMFNNQDVLDDAVRDGVRAGVTVQTQNGSMDQVLDTAEAHAEAMISAVMTCDNCVTASVSQIGGYDAITLDVLVPVIPPVGLISWDFTLESHFAMVVEAQVPVS